MNTKSTVVALLALALVGCDSDDTGGAASATGGAASGSGGGGTCEVDTTYDPNVDPADFVTAIDNPFYSLVPGTKFTYAEGEDTILIEVLAETKEIMGVTVVVVRDTHTGADGDVVEDTYDWFVQDKTGNVWYFGEDTKEYDNGMVISTEGSWETGVDGAKPGIVMPAAPKVGDNYRQEYYPCHAEDEADVLSLTEAVTVPLGSYTGCIKTHDFTRLDEAVNEEKYYCSGVGFVLAVDVPTGDREELTAIEMP